MSISLGTPVTGSSQTGFTSPNFVITADSAESDSKRYVVTSSTGTGTATSHTATSPFSIAFWRPRNVQALQAAGNDGIIRRFPRNRYGVTVRKGMLPAAGQVPQIAKLELAVDVPAGAETYNAAELRAALSLMIGAVNAQSAGFGDTLINNVL